MSGWGHYYMYMLAVPFITISSLLSTQASTFQDKVFKRSEYLQADVQRMRYLETKVENIESEVHSLRQLKTEIQMLKDLESEVESQRHLKSEVESLRHLKSEVESLRLLKSEVESLRLLKSEVEGLRHLKSEVQHTNRLESEVQYLRQENRVLQDKLNIISSTQQNGFSKEDISEEPLKNRIVKRLIGGDIMPQLTASATAFSVVLTSTFDRNIGKLHVFVYDHIECNLGGAYNNITGTFTAPRSGVFAFLWTVTAEGQTAGTSDYGELSTELVVNSNIRGRAHVDTEVGSDDDHSTGFVIVQLNQGDIVFVRSSGDYDVQGVFQGHLRGGWTFSGWQIA